MQERVFHILGRFSDWMTVAGTKVVKPLLERRGIKTYLTRSPDERIAFLTEISLRCSLVCASSAG